MRSSENIAEREDIALVSRYLSILPPTSLPNVVGWEVVVARNTEIPASIVGILLSILFQFFFLFTLLNAYYILHLCILAMLYWNLATLGSDLLVPI